MSQALLAALKKHGQHDRLCSVWRCKSCGLSKVGGYHDAFSNIRHDFTPMKCDCGLDVAIADGENIIVDVAETAFR